MIRTGFTPFMPRPVQMPLRFQGQRPNENPFETAEEIKHRVETDAGYREVGQHIQASVAANQVGDSETAQAEQDAADKAAVDMVRSKVF